MAWAGLTVGLIGCLEIPPFPAEAIAARCDACDVGETACSKTSCKGGACVTAPKSSETRCDDGLPCTDAHCDGAGICVSDAPTTSCECASDSDCADGLVCNGHESCRQSDSTCQPSMTPSNDIACDDGQFCTTDDHCADGACVGATRECSDAGPVCATDRSCDEDTQACVWSNEACACLSDTDCDDDNLCNGTETCAPKGSCEGGKDPVTCATSNDPCVPNVCAPKTGLCAPLAATGPQCDDGNPCTTNDVCQNGTCKSDWTWDTPCSPDFGDVGFCRYGECKPRAVDIFGHGCALVHGDIYCWGHNQWGVLGAESESTTGALPVKVELAVTDQPVALSLGLWFACAVVGASRVRCWGRTEEGIGGPGNQTLYPSSTGGPAHANQAIDFPDIIVELCSMDAVSCVLLKSGALHCWGFNKDGRLGTADENAKYHIPFSNDVTDLSCGSDDICVIRNGAVHCFGGDNWPVVSGSTPSPLPLPSTPFSRVYTTGPGACAQSDADVYCFGIEDTPASPTLEPIGPWPNGFAGAANGHWRSETGDIRSWQPELGSFSAQTFDMSLAKPPLPLEIPAVAQRGKGGLICAILATGAISCWGGPSFGAAGWKPADGTISLGDTADEWPPPAFNFGVPL